jgi:excisionase family DNA binding protein
MAELDSSGGLKRLAYSIREAASVLSLSRTTIYKLIAAGELSVVKIGTRSLIPSAAVETFLQRHTPSPSD